MNMSPYTMEKRRRFPRGSLTLLVSACVVLFTQQTRGVDSSTAELRVNETDSLPVLRSTNSAVLSTLADTSTSLPTYFIPSRGGLPSASGSNSTKASTASQTSEPFLTTDIPTVPDFQNFTALPVSPTAASRFLRGPSSDGTDEKSAPSYLEAFEEAYKQYLADYEAYLEAYYSAHAQPSAAHPFHAGYAVPGVKPFPARLPFFQTPPAGYPDFPYVFGYPVIFNGAGMIT